MQRLASENTILRESEDSSLLLQSIIDAVVDLSFPIATAYQELIVDLVRCCIPIANSRKLMYLLILRCRIPGNYILYQANSTFSNGRCLHYIA